MPGSIVYFTVYEALKRVLIEDPTNANPGLLLICGGVSGACTWTVCVPGDVLKSRYQMSVGAPAKNLTKLVMDIIRKEGIGSLYRGACPAIARAIPATAAVSVLRHVLTAVVTGPPDVPRDGNRKEVPGHVLLALARPVHASGPSRLNAELTVVASWCMIADFDD